MDIVEKRQETEEKVETKKYLIFELGNELFGIDTMQINIINRMTQFTRVPNMPLYIKGVFNLRGDILPVISLRIRFDIPEGVEDANWRIVITRFEDMLLGFIVDNVLHMIDLADDQLENIANVSDTVSQEYISGVGKYDGKVVTILNMEKLIREMIDYM